MQLYAPICSYMRLPFPYMQAAFLYMHFRLRHRGVAPKWRPLYYALGSSVGRSQLVKSTRDSIG